MKTIFLDIDGVLNNHTPLNNGYCGIDRERAILFNGLLYDSELVISSAWRYLVLNKYMTILGFENLLLTHGLKCHNKVKNITRQDRYIGEPREEQIKDYIILHKIKDYVVLDDLDLKIDNFYKVNNGLTEEDIKNIRKQYYDTKIY